MSDARTNPSDPRPRVNKEFEDPHFHDEEPDEQPDDGPREHRPAKKKPPGKLPPPRRRFYEE